MFDIFPEIVFQSRKIVSLLIISEVFVMKIGANNHLIDFKLKYVNVCYFHVFMFSNIPFYNIPLP